MMLDEKDAGKAELLGLDDIIDEIVITLAVAGRPTAPAPRRITRISSRPPLLLPHKQR
jgi:hypothetical protein